MLLHPTLEKLTTLRLTGMVAGLRDQENIDTINDLGFEERLGLRHRPEGMRGRIHGPLSADEQAL